MNEKIKTSTADYGHNYQPEASIIRAQRELEEAQGELEQAQHQLVNLVADYRWPHMSDELRRALRAEVALRVERSKEEANLKEQALNHISNEASRYRYLSELETKKAEQKREKEQKARAGAQAREQEARSRLQRSYLASGGTPAQFEEAWPDLWAKELSTHALDPVEVLKERYRHSGRYGF